jgi:hypothetical protein
MAFPLVAFLASWRLFFVAGERRAPRTALAIVKVARG